MSDVVKELLTEALLDKDVKEFIDKHKLDDDSLERYALYLYRYVSSKKICSTCKGLDECPLGTEGFTPVLKYSNGVVLNDKLCKYNGGEHTNLDLTYFPYELPSGELLTNDDRSETYHAIREYLKDPKRNKGIYLHGSYGTGKSFILLNLAMKLSDKGLKVMYIYYPDFSRKIKMGVGTFPVDEVINTCKYVDVIMFDDIGGEGASSYVRDDVLGPILQARMYMNKPTFFTSNLSISKLEEHLKDGKDINPVAAGRVCERIRSLTSEIELKGDNLR